jgi:hypothetical protein
MLLWPLWPTRVDWLFDRTSTTTMTAYEKLRAKLDELFMFDNADLDFGIFRIMNAKRAEIKDFLDNKLLPQVKADLTRHAAGDTAAIKAEMERIEQQAPSLGMPAAGIPRYKELQESLKQLAQTELFRTAIAFEAVEQEPVFGRAHTFQRLLQRGWSPA